MKRKIFLSLLLSMLLALGLTACGGQEVEPMEKERQEVSVENEPEEEVIQEESTDVQEENQVTENVETDAQEEVTEKVEEDVWIPDEFVYNDVTTLDFVAPAVHNGEGEPCTFLWNYTEEDLKAWYLEKFGDEEGQLRENVNNRKIRQDGGTRSYSISKNNYEENEAYSLSLHVGTYHESNVSQANLTIKDKDQEVVIAEAKAFLEMMGFGEYAEDIIYSEGWNIEIPTENNKGVYKVSSDYGTDKYFQNYSLKVGVEYCDYDYTDDFAGYDAVNLETWDDYFSLADYLENTEFDTSSLEAFTADERAFKEHLYGTTYEQNVSLEQTFSYSRYDLESLDDVEFEYWARATDIEDELKRVSGGLLLKFELDDGDASFDVSSYGRQRFEDRGEKRWVDDGEDITLDERQELCEARYQLMKKLDSNIDWTVEDLMNNFNRMEFDEECDKTHYYGDGYEYHIMNSLEGLVMYGEFEAKEEENVEE